MLIWIERRFGERLAAWRDRIQATLLRWRGARLADRVRIGSRCVVKRPWCLTVGERSQLEHQVHIKATDHGAIIRLGADVFVGCNSEFDIAESLWIGDGVLIAPGCFITDHQHRHVVGQPIATQGCESKPVRIEADVWLGAQVIVLPGITIGRGAIVAAGAVVTQDVAAMSKVAGVPARVIGVRSADR